MLWFFFINFRTTAELFIAVTNNLEDKGLDELDELEDEEDEKVLEEYRKKRIAEMRTLASKAKYGEVREISAQDYVSEVNNAGEDVWVILHLYKTGIPLCTLINQYLSSLARKFPATKFLKSISTTCIPNWPDKNLPTLFIYHNGIMVKQIIGPIELRGMKLTEPGMVIPFRIEFILIQLLLNIFLFFRIRMDVGTNRGCTNQNYRRSEAKST